jgi:hypothetical protein
MCYASAAEILVVDEESQNVDVLKRLMTRIGYDGLTGLRWRISTSVRAPRLS